MKEKEYKFVKKIIYQISIFTKTKPTNKKIKNVEDVHKGMAKAFIQLNYIADARIRKQKTKICKCTNCVGYLIQPSICIYYDVYEKGRRSVMCLNNRQRKQIKKILENV